MRFCDKVDELLKRNKITKRRLAIESGIGYSTIINWYATGTDQISYPTIVKLSKYFQVPVSYWTEDEIEMTIDEQEYMMYRQIHSLEEENIHKIHDGLVLFTKLLEIELEYREERKKREKGK